MILSPVKEGDVAIKGIVFDMDGTLCLPQTWMFAEMRSEIGLHDRSIDILKFIGDMSPDDQALANAKIAGVERKAMEQMVSHINQYQASTGTNNVSQEPQPGLGELMKVCHTHGSSLYRFCLVY